MPGETSGPATQNRGGLCIKALPRPRKVSLNPRQAPQRSRGAALHRLQYVQSYLSTTVCSGCSSLYIHSPSCRHPSNPAACTVFRVIHGPWTHCNASQCSQSFFFLVCLYNPKRWWPLFPQLTDGMLTTTHTLQVKQSTCLQNKNGVLQLAVCVHVCPTLLPCIHDLAHRIVWKWRQRLGI